MGAQRKKATPKADRLERLYGKHADESLGVGRRPGDLGTLPSPWTDTAAPEVRRVAVSKIDPDPTQPRKRFDDEALGRLAESLKARGQLQPIRVRQDEPSGRYLIIMGERRYRAARLAGLSHLTCVVHDGRPSADELLALQLVENCVREDLNPIERARAFKALMKQRKCSAREAAEFVGVDASGVLRALALLRLPPAVRRLVERGKLSGSAAAEMGRLRDKATCVELARRAVAESLTRDQVAAEVRALHRAAREAQNPAQTPAPEPAPTAGEITAALENLEAEIRAATPPVAPTPAPTDSPAPAPAREPGGRYTPWIARGADGNALGREFAARDQREAEEKADWLYLGRWATVSPAPSPAFTLSAPTPTPTPSAIANPRIPSDDRRPAPAPAIEPDADGCAPGEFVYLVRLGFGVAMVTVELPAGETDPAVALEGALRQAGLAGGRAPAPPSFDAGDRVRVARPNSETHQYHGLAGTIEDAPSRVPGSYWVVVDVPTELGSGHRCLYPAADLALVAKGGA